MRTIAFTLAAALVVAAPSIAQRSAGGVPPSAWSILDFEAPTLRFETPDVAAMREADALAPKGQPLRYGALQPVDAGVLDSGAWSSTDDGTPVWRLRLESPGALSVSVIFDDFELPAGAELFVYDDARELVLGAFTVDNNKANRQFATQPVPGSALTLELMQPSWADSLARVHIATLVHDYTGILKGGGLAGSGSCNIDVNCPQGAGWQDEKRSVARTLSGGALCSGALINNSANDGRQLFLTANHCGSMNNAVFLFNFERSGCGSGSSPSNQSVQGSVLQASGSSSDYRLVEIIESIPLSYDVFYAGWNRSSQAPSSTVGIHHPSGDVKKICFDNDAPSLSGSNWRVQQWDLGVTEGGSSGSPLFNPLGQIIGQLCCGAATCGFPFDDYYGRMNLSFPAMSSDLDPTGSGAISIGGLDPGNPASAPVLTSASPTSMPSFQGGLLTLNGTGLSSVSTVFIGGSPLSQGSLPGQYQVVSNSVIEILDPVSPSEGPTAITAENAIGGSNAVFVDFESPTTPVLSAPVLSFPSLPFTWNYAGVPNSFYLLNFQFNDLTVPFGGFDVLLSPSLLFSGTLSGGGTGSDGIPAAPTLGAVTVYFQLLTFDPSDASFIGSSALAPVVVI